MAQQNLIDIFDDCVRRLNNGASIEDCLRIYPQYASELRSLLEAGEQVRALRSPTTELLEDQDLIWAQVQQRLPGRLVRTQRANRLYLQLIAAILLLMMLASTWFLLTRPDLPDENPVVPAEIRLTSEPSATPSVTVTVTPTESVTQTATATPTDTPTATPTPTASSTATETEGITGFAQPGQGPTATFAPGCGAPLTAQQAADAVLEIYPNTTILEVEQYMLTDGRLIWEVKTSHGIEVTIDVACGYILTIERNSGADSGSGDGSDGSGGSSGSSGGNDNSDDDDDDDDNDDDDDDD